MATQVVELTGDEARLLRSLDKVIQKERDHEAQLRKVGDEGDKAGQKGKKGAQNAEKGWAKFGKNALLQVGAIGGGFVTVGFAVQKVSQFLEAQNDLYDKALSKQLSLAAAQQEGIKNLAGLSEANRLGLIDSAPDIARGTGFADLGQITGALGAAVSAGGDAESATSAVTAAARQTRNTPEALPELAAAAIDLRRATGRDDARENLGFLNLVGTQSRIVDPKALAESLAPALVSAVNDVPEQDKAEASRQAGALLAALTGQTADKSGKTSKTATVQLSAELRKFFGDLDQQRIEARSKIEVFGRAKNPLTEAQVVERDRLQKFLADSKGFTDPETLFGRIEALQQNAGIRSQFQSREFGQVEFKGVYAALADESSAVSQELRKAFEVIQISREAYERQVKEIDSATPVLKAAQISGTFAAGSEASSAEDSLGALRSLVRTELDKTLAETQQPTAGAFFGSFIEGTTFGNLAGSSVAAEAQTALYQTITRGESIRSDGVTSEELPDLKQIATATEGFTEALTQALILDPSSLSEVRRINQIAPDREATILDENGELKTVSSRELMADAIAKALRARDEQADKLFAQQVENQKRYQEQQLELARRGAEAAERTADSLNAEPETPNYGNTQRGRQ